jgi:hypothetical protein
MREDALRHGTDCFEVIHGLLGARAALDPSNVNVAGVS